jgi:energy-coupling factor transporter ATP-binding protein EcfA2
MSCCRWSWRLQPTPRSEAERWLQRVGLAHRLQHYPKHLSGGEQQRVALARAFAPRPRLVLADEPTGNLDAVTGHQVIELMFAINAESATTLILVTHDEEIAARCHRRLRMEAGQLEEVSSVRVAEQGRNRLGEKRGAEEGDAPFPSALVVTTVVQQLRNLMSLMVERVANLKTPEECAMFEKNVLERGRPDLAVAARKRALELRAEKYGAGSEPERQCLEAVYAYEGVLSARNGKATRDLRTWQLIKRHGIIGAVERAVNREPETVNGYSALLELGLEDYAFEGSRRRHADLFSAGDRRVLADAHRRLENPRLSACSARAVFEQHAPGGVKAAAHGRLERSRVVGADIVAGQPQAGARSACGRALQAGAARESRALFADHLLPFDRRQPGVQLPTVRCRAARPASACRVPPRRHGR